MEFESEKEHEEAYNNWLESDNFINRHNLRKDEWGYSVGHNKFSIISHEQYLRRYSLGEYSNNPWAEGKPIRTEGVTVGGEGVRPNQSVDWR